MSQSNSGMFSILKTLNDDSWISYVISSPSLHFADNKTEDQEGSALPKATQPDGGRAGSRSQGIAV